MSSRPDDAPSSGTTTLAVLPTSSPVSALGLSRAALAEMKSWLSELKAFTNDILVEGIDYGREPGIEEKFLHKPGSEKLMLVYNLRPEFFPIEADTIRDWSANPPHIQLAFRCVLRHRASGMIVGEGSGVCSTWESKYKYRAEWWQGSGTPPEGEGWKKTRTGFRKQTINPDVADSVNTVLKMAQKRSQVDAVLRATATSMFFKQELDDVKRPEENEPVATPEDPATADKIARMIERIESAPRADALTDLATEIGKDPILSRKNSKGYKNPVRAAYQKRHGEIKAAKPADPAETPTTPKNASPSTTPKESKPAEPVLPGTEREPGADEEEDSDPGPPEESP